MSILLRDLLAATGGRCVPESAAARTVRQLSTLEAATSDDAALVTSERWSKAAATSNAGVLITSEKLLPTLEGTPQPKVVVNEPWAAAKWLLESLHPDQRFWFDGIHPTAVIHPSAVLGHNVAIGPGAVIGPQVTIGDRTRIAPNVVVGSCCTLGVDVTVMPNVVLEPGVIVGDRVILHAGSVLGADGFKYEVIAGRREKIPQVGIVRIGDDVEIGANTCVDRASLTETVVGANTKMDNLVQIGHNVRTGTDCVFVSGTAIGGSTTIGNRVIIAGQAGIADNIELGDDVVVLAQAGVMQSLESKSQRVGSPARDPKDFFRQQAALVKLPDLVKEVRRLSARIEELEAKLAGQNTEKEEQP